MGQVAVGIGAVVLGVWVYHRLSPFFADLGLALDEGAENFGNYFLTNDTRKSIVKDKADRAKELGWMDQNGGLTKEGFKAVDETGAWRREFGVFSTFKG